MIPDSRAEAPKQGKNMPILVSRNVHGTRMALPVMPAPIASEHPAIRDGMFARSHPDSSSKECSIGLRSSAKRQ